MQGVVPMHMPIMKYMLITLLLMVAVPVAVALDASVSELTIGDRNQEASNAARFIDRYTSTQFSLFTTEEVSFSVAPVSPYKQSTGTIPSMQNELNITVSQSISSDSNTITITGRIPEALPAVDTRGRVSSFKVADVTFTANGSSITLPLYMQRRNQLEFGRVELRFGDVIERITDNKRIDKIKPGDSALIEAQVRNTFTSAANVDIFDVMLLLVDDNNDLDFDEEENIGTLRRGDDLRETVSFSVDNNIRERTYPAFLRVTGIDEFGARHGTEYTVQFRIDRDRDDVHFRRIELSPNTVDNCQDRFVSFSLSLENIGRNRQRNAAVTAENTDLNYFSEHRGIDLEREDSRTIRFSAIVPEGASSGVYRFTLRAWNDREEVKDEQILTLVVNSCQDGTQQPPPQQQPDRPDSDQPAVQLIMPQTGGAAQPLPPPVQPSEPERFPVLLFVLVLVLLVACFALVILALKK